jgi:hypothetical protein
MVMTIGELHTGHCIDPSLADAVKQRNEIRCAERLRTRDGQVRPQPIAWTTRPHKVIFGAPDLSGWETDRVVRPFVVAMGQPRQYVFSSEDSTFDTADMTSISGESTVEGQSGLLTTGSRTRSPDQQVM